jgi:hypothetical protein
MSFRVVMPDNSIGTQMTIERAVLKQAQDTRLQGNPIAGITSRLVIGNFMLGKDLGRILVIATFGEQTLIAGTLNFVAAESPPTP